MVSRNAASQWKKRTAVIGLAVGLVVTSLVLRQLIMKPGLAEAQGKDQPKLIKPSAQAQPLPKPAVRPQPAPPATATVADNTQQRTLKVVAMVNGQKISRQQLARECLLRYGEEVLQTVINKHLIQAACQANDVTISNQQVIEEIDRMASKFGLSRDLFLRTIQDDRKVPLHEFRQEIWGRLALKQLAAKSIQVSEQDLQRAFETEYGPRVRVRMIVTSTLDKAQQIRRMALAAPDRFGDLAKDHSEDQNSASVRGLISPIRKHVEDPQVEQAAFSLNEGQISPVVPAAGKFLVLKCEKRLPPVYVARQFQADARRRLGDRIQFEKLRAAAGSYFQKLQTAASITNVYNDPQLSKQMPGIVALVNNVKISERELAEQCISNYGDIVLDGEINRALLAQALQQRDLQISRSDLDAEIARAADSFGFLKSDDSPDVASWLKKVTVEGNVSVDLYVRDTVWPTAALKKLIGDSVQVSAEDMQKGFISHYGERVEVLAIVLANHRQATTVWDLAKNNPTEYYFGQLAEQYSIEPVSRSNAGRVPPIRQHGGRPLIEKEVFRLKTGELSGIVSIADKYIIMRCLGRTAPIVSEISEVRQELYKDLYENKLRLAMNDRFDELKIKAEVVNFLDPVTSIAPVRTSRTIQPIQR